MKSNCTVLIADDDPLKTLTLKEFLSEAGYNVLVAEDGNAALVVLKTETVDALITDVRMPGLDGISLLEASMQLNPNRPVLVMTGYDDVSDAVRAMRAGAVDYMVKPVSGEEIGLRLDRAMAHIELAGANLSLRQEVQELKAGAEPVIMGEGMKPTREALERVAATNATVLMVGETGTGKEVCTRYLHRRSQRAGGPFIPVPCAALPQSLIESELFGHEKGAFTGASVRRDGYIKAADGGTLFLDDIDDLPMDIQGRLLRVLQTHTFQRVGSTRMESADIRVVAATKKDLAALVEQKLFRDDLMYRLSVVTIHIPPLRSRREDVPVLADFFLKSALNRLGRKPRSLSEDALKMLQAYDWPGNVRQLEHAIESAVVLHSGPVIQAHDLPAAIRAAQEDPFFTLHTEGRQSIPFEPTLAAFERSLLKWALDMAHGNQANAAKLLGLPRSTFQYRLSKGAAKDGEASAAEGVKDVQEQEENALKP